MVGLFSSSLAQWLSGAPTSAQESPLEAQLHEANEVLAALSRSSAMLELDLEGTILSANDNLLALFEYRRDELIGQHHRRLVTPAHAESPDYDQFWRMLRGGDFQAGQFERVRRDGSTVHIQATYNPIFDRDGRPVRIVKLAADVTPQVHGQHETARLSNMMENLPINVMFADRDHVIRYINPASRRTLQKIERLLPVPVDKVVGSSVDIFHQNPAHQRKLLSDPANLPVSTQFTLGPETIELSVSPIFDRQKRYVGAMSCWQIITEQALLRQQVSNLADVGHTVANNVSEMVIAMDEISHSIGRNAELAQDTNCQVANAGESIRQLSDCSGQIADIVTVIRELAEQTNLLALNATIEAARAGDAGRSFAVVASEVKSLATETRDATENIADRVHRIRTNIEAAVAANQGITTSVAEVSQNSNTVAAAIEEQTAIINGMRTTAENLVQLSQDLRKL